MDRDSFFHVADRYFAVPLVFVELCKLLIMFQYVRPLFLFLYVSAFAFAIYSHQLSSMCQTAKDLNGFIFWHNMWHLFPIFESVITFIDIRLFPECESNEKNAISERTVEAPALSNIVMQKLLELKKSA